MITSFSKMDKSSRVWIYQSNRKLIDFELKEIEESLCFFLNNWTAHGSGLQTSYQIKYNRFIIIALNESDTLATGCSIDKCVHFVQELEVKYDINLLDKMNISFKQGEYISYKSINDFKRLVKNKSVSKKTIVFNNLVLDISDFLKNWETPAEKSWHSRFFNG
tara:strand:+ start:594 stop:1082 length:489 start_codon:yes stop_codon:yes gene_type:complete